MEIHGVVPEILKTVPKNAVLVQFPSGGEMHLGNELTPFETVEAPTVLSWPIQQNTLYSVLFIDPDAPTRIVTSYRSVIHWLVVNCLGTDLAKGDTVYPYTGPGAPEGFGLKRYVLLVYKQTAKIDANSFANKTVEDRFHLDIEQFQDKYSLEMIAVNFFQCQCDDYIRQRRAHLVAEAFKAHRIVPDVIDTIPESSVEVVYPSGTLLYVHGKELTPTQVQNMPSIFAWKAEPKSLYTVILTDPDASNIGEFLHWLVVNIPDRDIEAGEIYAEYIGSGPPKGTGLHRYIFLVYKQQGSLSLARSKISKQTTDGRLHFKVRDFAREYGLGDPVAGSLYQAQFDDYVLLLHKQLGFN